MILMSRLDTMFSQVLKQDGLLVRLLGKAISNFKLNLMRFIEFCAQHCLYSKPQLSVEGVLLSIPGKKK